MRSSPQWGYAHEPGMGRKDMVLTVGRKDQGWIIDCVPRGRKVQALKPLDLETHYLSLASKVPNV